MKLLNISIIYIVISFSTILSQKVDRIKINLPTAKEECKYVWQVMKNYEFYKKYKYELALPKHGIIDILKSNKDSLTEKNYSKLYYAFYYDIYDKYNYKNGFINIKKSLPLIEDMVSSLYKYQKLWGFRIFPTYNLNLTQYGPGGKYNPIDGSILLYTSKDGNFKMYKEKAAYTIIHEIVHIGIEECIVTRFNVDQPLKERIVDLFVKHHFGSVLTDYKVENNAGNKIDSYLKTDNDFENLPKRVELFLKHNGMGR